MTPKERFICALNLGTPDRVPTFELEFQLAPELFGKESDYCRTAYSVDKREADTLSHSSS